MPRIRISPGFTLLLFTTLLVYRSSCVQGATCQAFPSSWAPEKFCVSSYVKDIKGARGMFMNENSTKGDLLVVARSESTPSIYSIWGQSPDERKIIASQGGLNHGIAVYAGYLFASSDDKVYRWAYSPGQRTLLGSASEVVTGIGRGGHTTRTIIFDRQGRMYVSVGSYGNVDADSERSRIRRFSGMDVASVASVEYSTGEVFADGLRNEVGLELDKTGNYIFGVENGPDNLDRQDLGGSSINDDAAAEELNRFPVDQGTGAFYGYPYCFSEYKLPAGVSMGEKTQWAWPGSGKTDAWCRDTDNVKPPVLAMQAHSAPLGITFFDSSLIRQGSCGQGGAFPCDMDGHAFVAFHGSWNRNPPTGYKLVRIPFGANGLPSGPPEDFVRNSGSDATWPSGMRPVDVLFDTAKGRMFFSSAVTNEIMMVTYAAEGQTAAPTVAGGDTPEPTPDCCTNGALTTTPTPKDAGGSQVATSGWIGLFFSSMLALVLVRGRR